MLLFLFLEKKNYKFFFFFWKESCTFLLLSLLFSIDNFRGRSDSNVTDTAHATVRRRWFVSAIMSILQNVGLLFVLWPGDDVELQRTMIKYANKKTLNFHLRIVFSLFFLSLFTTNLLQFVITEFILIHPLFSCDLKYVITVILGQYLMLIKVALSQIRPRYNQY